MCQKTAWSRWVGGLEDKPMLENDWISEWVFEGAKTKAL
jgi:hypothetical protein